MCHPLYPHACRMIGRPVYVYHTSGRVYHGTLLSVAQHGIYVMPHGPTARLTRSVGFAESGNDVGICETDCGDVQAELVYAPGRYFAFGALTGLTLGALAGGMFW